MTTALRPDPVPNGDDDARYGNGVPSGLKPGGLSFIEMTGIPRPAWVRATGAAEAFRVPELAAATSAETPETPVGITGTAAALFEGILNAITGDGPPLEEDAPASGAQSIDELEQEPELIQETPSIYDERRVERPASAVNALAEAEQLMSALDRAPAPRKDIAALDATAIASLQQAFESPARQYEIEVPNATGETSAPDEDLTPDSPPADALPSLDDFVPGIRKASLPPTPSPAPSTLQEAVLKTAPTQKEAAPPPAADPSAPGYTLLGHGPVTWPGVSPRPHRAGMAFAMIFLVLACTLSAAGVWFALASALDGAMEIASHALLLSLACGLVSIGLLIALTRRRSAEGDAILRGLDAVSSALGVEVIGAIPFAAGLRPPVIIESAPAWAGFPLLVSTGATTQSSLAEAFNVLHTNFRFATPRENVRSVCFVSAVPGEGLKTIAFNFAATHAQRGHHVLFIAEDRAPQKPPADNGPHVVRERFDIPNLYCTDAPATGEGYDLVVTAGQALLSAPEARHAAARADATVLVLDPAVTSREMALRAVQLLRDARAPLAGVVANRVRSAPLRRAYQRRAGTRTRHQ